MNTYWHKQNPDQPLFPDLLWSRPENRTSAGKLLIIGGNAHGFAAPAEAYQVAAQAGAGLTRVLLPLSVKIAAGQLLETVDYAPSTPSGSFSQQALGELLDHTSWADAVLLAGDFGHNSETAVLLEKYAEKSPSLLAFTQDTVDYFAHLPLKLLARQNTMIVVSMAQLQKLAKEAPVPQVFTFSMTLLQLVEALHGMTTKYPCYIIVKHLDQLVVASGGEVSTTKLQGDLSIWRVHTSAYAIVWWLQNPSKPFAALSTAVYSQISKNR